MRGLLGGWTGDRAGSQVEMGPAEKGKSLEWGEAALRSDGRRELKGPFRTLTSLALAPAPGLSRRRGNSRFADLCVAGTAPPSASPLSPRRVHTFQRSLQPPALASFSSRIVWIG